jgi:sterol 14-demethylase
MDAIIRETLRFNLTGVALRRNLENSLRVADKTIEKGAFVAYNLADVHMNERFYPEPHKFDPGRFNLAMEENTQGSPFLGWGVGRHPCTGEMFRFCR